MLEELQQEYKVSLNAIESDEYVYGGEAYIEACYGRESVKL